MRVLVLLCAFILAACSCTIAGCFGGLDVRLDRSLLDEGATYTVRVCIDGGCWVVDEELRHTGDPLEMNIPLRNQQVGSEAHVTLDFRDEKGDLVDEYTGDVTFSHMQPNGRWCEPTCWYGTIQRP